MSQNELKWIRMSKNELVEMGQIQLKVFKSSQKWLKVVKSM